MSSDLMVGPNVARFATLFFAVVGAGAVLYSRRGLLGDERTLFSKAVESCSSEVRSRIAAAIERRRCEERLEAWPAWLACALLALECTLVLIGRLHAQTGLALQLVTFLTAMSAQLLRARRVAGSRRLASLHSRSMLRLIGPLHFGLPPISVAFGAVFVWNHDKNLTAIVAMIVGFGIAFATAIRAAQSPAIVGDADPVTDEIIDQKVRTLRIRQLLLIAGYGPLLLSYATSSDHSGDPIVRAIWLISLTMLIVVSNQAVKVSAADLNEMVMEKNALGGRR